MAHRRSIAADLRSARRVRGCHARPVSAGGAAFPGLRRSIGDASLVGGAAGDEEPALERNTVTDGVAGLDLRSLEHHFAAHVPDFGGELSARLLEGGRSNLTYALTDQTHRWV